jgi:hypothetical protein
MQTLHTLYPEYLTKEALDFHAYYDFYGNRYLVFSALELRILEHKIFLQFLIKNR